RSRSESIASGNAKGAACSRRARVGPRVTTRLPPKRLTVKWRGRTEAPHGAEGAQFLSARGAKPTTPHGPLQRLLDGRAARISKPLHLSDDSTAHRHAN